MEVKAVLLVLAVSALWEGAVGVEEKRELSSDINPLHVQNTEQVPLSRERRYLPVGVRAVAGAAGGVRSYGGYGGYGRSVGGVYGARVGGVGGYGGYGGYPGVYAVGYGKR